MLLNLSLFNFALSAAILEKRGNCQTNPSGIPECELSNLISGSENIGFSIQFNCDNVGEFVCNNSRNAIESAAKRISNELRFRRNVTVVVEFESFGVENGPVAKTFAGPTYVGQQEINGQLGQKYTFPQALIRQMQRLPTGFLSDEADFTLVLDTDVSWSYLPRKLKTVGENRMDMECIVY